MKDSDIVYWQDRVKRLEARLAEAERCIGRARSFMRGEIVNDQGEAWDQALRVLDAYGATVSAEPALCMYCGKKPILPGCFWCGSCNPEVNTPTVTGAP